MEPWTSPPPCNTSLECDQLLRALYPNENLMLGSTRCFDTLQTEINSLGGCGCFSGLGLGGPTCAEQTTASPSSSAMMILALTLVVFTIGWFLPTLWFVGIGSNKRILKFNAVGVTYVSTWIGLLACFLNALSVVLETFLIAPGVSRLHEVSGKLQIIFLTLSVLNLVAAIVELSTTMKKMRNISKFRIPVFVSVFVVSWAVILTYLLAPPLISSVVGLVVILLLGLVGFNGPVWVFYQAAFKEESANNVVITPSMMVKAMAREVCVGRNTMLSLFGHSRSNSGKEGSSSGNKQGETSVFRFFSRALRLGVWLGESLMVFIAGTFLAVFYSSTNDEHPTFRVYAFGIFLQIVGISSSFHQLLWFLDDAYNKTKKAARQKQNSKLTTKDSKSPDPSKEGSKVEDSKVAGVLVVQAFPAPDLVVQAPPPQ